MKYDPGDDPTLAEFSDSIRGDVAKAPVCISHAEGGVCKTGKHALSMVGVHSVQAFPTIMCAVSHMMQVPPLKVTMYTASSMRPMDMSVNTISSVCRPSWRVIFMYA